MSKSNEQQTARATWKQEQRIERARRAAAQAAHAKHEEPASPRASAQERNSS